MLKRILLILALSLASSSVVAAESISVVLKKVSHSNSGDSIGKVVITQVDKGVLIKPFLINLTPGIHGFHVHKFPKCGNFAKDAGSHFDPDGTGSHLGPYAKGHRGDLPVIFADKNGVSNLPVYAPNIELKDFKGHSLVIHEGGDNYSDKPVALGGGGPRFACGVISK